MPVYSEVDAAMKHFAQKGLQTTVVDHKDASRARTKRDFLNKAKLFDFFENRSPFVETNQEPALTQVQISTFFKAKEIVENSVATMVEQTSDAFVLRKTMQAKILSHDTKVVFASESSDIEKISRFLWMKHLSRIDTFSSFSF